jgi:hypothetical protein
LSAVLNFVVVFALTLLGGSLGGELGKYAIRTFTTALTGIMTAVIYHELRVAKEGIDIEQIASVFD